MKNAEMLACKLTSRTPLWLLFKYTQLEALLVIFKVEIFFSESEKREYQRLWEQGPAHRALPAAYHPSAAEDFTQHPLGTEDGEEPREANAGSSPVRQVWVHSFRYLVLSCAVLGCLHINNLTMMLEFGPNNLPSSMKGETNVLLL